MSGLLLVPTLLLGSLIAQGSSAVVQRLPHDPFDNVEETEGDDGAFTSPFAYKADLPSSGVSEHTSAPRRQDLEHAASEQAPSVTELAKLVDKYDDHVFGASATRPQAMQRFAIMSSEAVKAEHQKGQRRLRDVMQVARTETRRAAELSTALKEEHSKADSLSHELHDVEAEKSQLSKTLGEAGSKIETLSSNIVSVYREAQTKIRGLKATIASKDKAAEEKEKEASTQLLKQEMEEKALKEETSQLSAKLEESRSKATAAENSAETLKASLETKEKALQGQRWQSSQLREKWKGLRKETSDLTARLEAINQTRSREEAEQATELKTLWSKLHTKEGQLAKANRDLTSASTRATKEEDNSMHLQQALKDLAGELQTVHAKLHAQEEASAATAHQAEALKELTGKLNAMNTKLQTQAEEASASDAKALKELKLRVKSLSSSLDSTQSELKAMKSSERSLKAGMAAQGQAETRARKADQELAHLKEAIEKDQQALKLREQSLKSGMVAQGAAEARADNVTKELARLRETIESERKARAAAELKMASQFNKKLASEEKKASDLQKQLDAERKRPQGGMATPPPPASEAENAAPGLLGDTARLLEETSTEAQKLVQDKSRMIERQSEMEHRLQATEAELANAQHMVQVRDAAIKRLGSALNESIEAQEENLASSHAAQQPMPSKATMLESLHRDMQKLKRLAPAEFEDMARLFKVQQAHRQTLRKLAECRVSNHVEKALETKSEDHQGATDRHSQELRQELHRVARELQSLRTKVDSVFRHIRRGNAALMKKVRKAPDQHVGTEFLQAGHGSFAALAEETTQQVEALSKAVDRYNARASTVQHAEEASALQSSRHLQSHYGEVMLEMTALDAVYEKSSSTARLLDYMRAAVGA